MPLNPGDLNFDCTFELDHFFKPRLRDEAELIKNTLMTVLFFEPGQYPSLPMIGMNIREKLYSFYDEIDASNLQKDIIEQCAALRLPFENGQIQVVKQMYKGRPALLIHISTDTNDRWADDYVVKEKARKQREYFIGVSLDELNRVVYGINTKTS